MIVKTESNTFTQKCSGCGEIHQHNYSDMQITTNFIGLPVCGGCGSLEVLHNNNQDDTHSLAVSKVFANVATAQG